MKVTQQDSNCTDHSTIPIGSRFTVTLTGITSSNHPANQSVLILSYMDHSGDKRLSGALWFVAHNADWKIDSPVYYNVLNSLLLQKAELPWTATSRLSRKSVHKLLGQTASRIKPQKIKSRIRESLNDWWRMKDVWQWWAEEWRKDGWIMNECITSGVMNV